MSVAYPILPSFKPAQSFTAPPSPTRGLTWVFKVSKRFMNYPQVSVSGRTSITKYRSNPLRNWEFKYGYISDDPTGFGYNLGHNTAFYGAAVPSTDFAVLDGFYTGMQGSGNQFAFCPPGYQTGKTFAVTQVQTIAGTPGTVIFTLSSSAASWVPFIGYPIYAINTTQLSGSYSYITAVSGSTVTCNYVATLGGSSTTGSGGVITMGQIQSQPDSNGNIELVYNSGSYPTLLGQAYQGSVTLVSESVQVIDTSSLTLYDGNGNTISINSLSAPNTVYPPQQFIPYLGYVMNVSGTPTAPITASYNLYYLCRFSEDTQEYDNFLTTLWMSTIKFQQDRI